MKRIATTVITIALCAALPGRSALAETKYVTDIFEITMRSGTSTANSIVRMLKSGEPVTVLEQDLATQYSLVQTADGKQGYVLSRFLMNQPAARQSIEELRNRFAQQGERLETQAASITELETALEQEKADNQALKTTLRASEQELAEVRVAAEDTLNILEQNGRLQTLVEELRTEKAALEETNASLSDSTRMDWFVRGGAVSLIAFLIGIIVTRIRWRKQDSWGSY
jgi:SH3 domain protein